jgi:RNA polymerase sigma factor (sigma-70 family)
MARWGAEDMRDERTDAQMVGAYLTGDATAFAGIYDRYADALHDTAAGMLRDPHEAADATQDVFLVAAERLGQLRDPDRLRPWLFAILRNEVYRRTRRRARQRPVDFSRPGAPDVAAPADPDAEAGAASTRELAADLRAAAQGLDARDQLVLELTTRQHLAGADLADALGVSLDQSYVVVHRMRERVERSLGAFLVARTGRRDCADLQRILGDWDGRFSVLIRKRVARHVDECPTCAETRRRVAVLPLAGLAPAFAAPAALRDDVLAAVGARASQGHAPPAGQEVTIVGRVTASPVSTTGWREDGFPTDARGGARRPAALLAAAALVVVLLVGLLVLAWGGGGTPDAGPPPPSVAPGPASAAETTAPAATALTSATEPPAASSSVVAPGSTAASATPTTTTTTATTTTTTSTTLAPSTTAAPGAPAPPTTVATPEPPPSPAPTTPPVVADPPAPTTTAAPLPPPPDATPTTSTTVPAPPADRTPPSVRVVRAPQVLTCPWSVAPLVAAVVEDDSALDGVRLRWSGPGASGSTAMTASGGGWAGALGLDAVSGTWSWTVTAIDTAGNTGQAGGTTVVTGC